MPSIINLGSRLSKEQQLAFDEILHFVVSYPQKRSPIFVVSGYAGTGKTHLFGDVHSMLQDIGLHPIPMTFTGKAASVINDRFAIGTRTIHSVLYKPILDKHGNVISFAPISEDKNDTQSFREKYPLPVFMVDEGSMVPESLLLEMMKHDAPVIFFGDSEQLPPIDGNGESIMDHPDVTLTEIHRQAEKSPIIRLSRHIRETGDIGYNKFKNEISYVKRHDVNLNFIKEYMPDMMICGTNRRKDRLNNLYRMAIGYAGTQYPQTGDRIMILKNSGLFKNGEIYTVESTQPTPDGEDVMFVNIIKSGVPYRIAVYKDTWLSSFNDKRYNIPVEESHTNRIEPACFAYAATCHKVQGSEYDKGIFYDEDVSYFLDQRRFRYTAVTRFKNDLIIAT